jgi:hypothetical protein
VTTIVRPSWLPVGVGVALAALSVVLAVLAGQAIASAVLWFGGAGYLCGALGTIICASWYRATRNRARQDPWYQPLPAGDVLIKAALVAGLAGGLWCAFLVATELAK